MRKSAFGLGLLLIANVAAADRVLIREVETLRNSLPIADPARRELTLRLADLFFEEAVADGHADLNQRAADQKRAISLYEMSLNGDGGTFAPVSGSLRYKVEFQLARLYADTERFDKASPLWKNLVTQTELPTLRREASLRLAEVEEKAGTPASLAEADKYLATAIELCAGTDVCSYSHYRRGWLYKNRGMLEPAIAEIEQALWDSKGQVREEAVRDWILFLASQPGDGLDGLKKVDDLARKIQRPSLLLDLSEGFFSAGNRVAGAAVLAQVQARTPRLAYQIRLMEESYGARNWDKTREWIEAAKASPGAPLEGREFVESEKVLRRFSIQLDGERVSQPRFADDFKRVTELYLSLFPTNPDRMKMIEGWMAAETDSARKIAQLGSWIADTRFAFTVPEQITLREFRAAGAQKAKQPEIVREEMQHLIQLAGNPEAGAKQAKQREYRFLYALSLHELKSPEALPALRALAELKAGEKADSMKLQSQQLVLALLTESKQYAELVQQIDSWIAPEKLKAHPELESHASELKRMQELKDEARFEVAVGQGRTSGALAVFHEYCLAKKFLPKSCDNARVLAVEIKAQPVLFSVLKTQNRLMELESEYEAAGYFADAAGLAEKRAGKAVDTTTALKVALLYEIEGKTADRDRCLRDLVQRLKREKSLGIAEDLLRQTLLEIGPQASWVDRTVLDLAWKPENRAPIAEFLESHGRGSAAIRSMILTEKQSTGPVWTRLVLEKVQQLDTDQRKISFHGRRGAQKFAMRMEAMKKLVQSVEHYLPGADRSTRVRLLGIVSRAQKDLGESVLQSPIPAEVTGEDAEALKASIAEMAKPFLDQASRFQTLADDETAKATDPAEKAQLAAVFRGGAPTGATTSQVQPVMKDLSGVRAALERLHADPQAVDSLAAIQKHFQDQGQGRLATYFEGRILQLRKEGKAP